jgi:hypothetical protein
LKNNNFMCEYIIKNFLIIKNKIKNEKRK